MEKTEMVNVKLVVVGGAPEGDEFLLHLPCVLGRAKSADIPLPHPLVSRNHCQLFEQDNLLFVKDLGSTNGTFVGSERIEECVIRHGDLLTIGTVTFRAMDVGVPQTRPLSADRAGVPLGSTDTPVHAAQSETCTLNQSDTGILSGKVVEESADGLNGPSYHRPNKAK